MVVWGVVSSEIEQVIEFFRTRREAERMLAEVVNQESGTDAGAQGSQPWQPFVNASGPKHALSSEERCRALAFVPASSLDGEGVGAAVVRIGDARSH
jgi:hypothetical protein